MSSFSVTVKTARGRFSYTAIASSSFDLHAAAIDQYGLCSVSIVRQA